MKAAINLEGPNPQSVRAVRDAILAILKVPYVDNETKRVAILQLNSMCGVSGNVISNCSFVSGE